MPAPFGKMERQTGKQRFNGPKMNDSWPAFSPFQGNIYIWGDLASSCFCKLARNSLHCFTKDKPIRNR